MGGTHAHSVSGALDSVLAPPCQHFALSSSTAATTGTVFKKSMAIKLVNAKSVITVANAQNADASSTEDHRRGTRAAGFRKRKS